MRFTIEDTHVESNTFEGRTYYKQNALLWLEGETHPDKVTVSVTDGQPHPKGDYKLDPSSFRIVGRKLTLGAVRLLPAPSAKS